MTRAQPACASRSSQGFTLIEMLVVLVIVGLAIGVVASAIPRRSIGLDLAAETDTLVNALRLARAQAIAQSRAVAFAAVPGGGGWRLDGVAHALPPDVSLAITGPAITGPAITGPATLRFAPDGSSSGARLTLVAGSRVSALQVDWLTGRVVEAGN